MTAAPPPSPPSLADRLRGVVVSPRADLEVSRHVFRDAPTYVVRDPITFQSHALTPQDYDLFVALDGEATLGEKFAALTDARRLEPDDEAGFYDFVLGLHRLGLLTLPVADDKLLYQRFEKRRQAHRRSLLMGFLFLRVPLWNPDAFLDATVRFARPLFTPVAGVLWAALMLGCALLAATRWDDLTRPVLSVFDASQLPLLWLILVGLKTVHEFGHAYAAKALGGRVPEMGVFMIAFTPCAYVDATAAWGFTHRRHRLLVNLAGVYVESLAAAAALIVWSLTGPGLVNTAAYQTLLLASVVTLGFNINPLARFDGYYVLADLTNIPNLRAKGQHELLAAVKRLTLGLRTPPLPLPAHVRAGLLAYGVASLAYRVLIVLGIALLVATKHVILGLGVAAAFLAMMLITALVKATRFLLFARETAAIRLRAAVVAALLLIGLPAALLALPVPLAAEARGTLQPEQLTVLRAPHAGFIAAPGPHAGVTLAPGDAVALLDNPELRDQHRLDRAQLRLAREALAVAHAQSPADAQQAIERLTHARARAAASAQRAAALTVTAPHHAALLATEADGRPGRYVARGETLAQLGAGPWRLTVLVGQATLTQARLAPGDRVPARPLADPSQTFTAELLRIAPAGSRQLQHESLAQHAGGDIIADPATGRAAEPLFELTLRIDDHHPALRHQATVAVRLDTQPMTLGHRLVRRAARLVHDLAAY